MANQNALSRNSKLRFIEEIFSFKEKNTESEDFKTVCRYTAQAGLGCGSYGRCVKAVKQAVQNQQNDREHGQPFVLKIFNFRPSETIQKRLVEKRRKQESKDKGEEEPINNQPEGQIRYRESREESPSEKEHNEHMFNFKNEKEIMNYIDQHYGGEPVLSKYFVKIFNSWTEPYQQMVERKKGFIVMEYCQSGDLEQLRDRIRANGSNLSPREILYFARDVLVGLHLLHCFKIIHLDIKLKNVFVDQSYQAKIGDYGITFKGETSTFSRSLYVGTPSYMAPQVIRCKNLPREKRPQYCYEPDVFSFGCLVYNLLYCEVPQRNGEDSGLSVESLKRIEITKQEERDRDLLLLKKLMLGCLVTEPSKRTKVVNLLQLFKEQMGPMPILKSLTELIQTESLYFSQEQTRTIREGLALKLKSPERVLVLDIYFVEKLGFMFLLSNCVVQVALFRAGGRLEILKIEEEIVDRIQEHLEHCINEGQVQINEEEIKDSISQSLDLNRVEEKIRVFFVFLQQHEHILDRFEQIKTSPKCQELCQKTRSSIQNLMLVNSKTAIVIMSNGAAQCFLSASNSSELFNVCISAGHHRNRPKEIKVKYLSEGDEQTFENFQEAQRHECVGKYVQYFQQILLRQFRRKEKEFGNLNQRQENECWKYRLKEV